MRQHERQRTAIIHEDSTTEVESALEALSDMELYLPLSIQSGFQSVQIRSSVIGKGVII